jgi:hypothetical protein
VGMAMNKKGFFFTLLSILFIAIFVVVFTSTSEITQRQYIEAGRIEATALDTFTKDMKYVFLENAMQASARGALKAMIEYNEHEGAGFADVEGDFNLIVKESGLEETIDLVDLGMDVEDDIEMILHFWGSPSLTMNLNGSTGPLMDFGGDSVVFQSIVFPNTTYPNWEDYHLDTVTLFIKKQSTAPNQNLSLSIYEEHVTTPTEYHLIARDMVLHDGATDLPIPINFTFDQLVELDPEKNYSLVLAAPYVVFGEYKLKVGLTDDYDCTDYGKECSAELGTLAAGSDRIVWPLDYTLGEEVMGQSSFVELVGSVNKLAKEYFHTRVNLSYGDFEITQNGPWELSVSTSYNISNERTSSSIELSTDVDADISIIGLKDPLQKINGIDIEILAENETNETTIWTEELLEKHVTNHSFILNENAPSFLDRLEGDYTAQSSNGISTLYDGDEFGVLAGLGDPELVHTIDYKYGFVTCQFAPSDDQVNTVLGWVGTDVYLDPDTALLYQIEDIPAYTLGLHTCSVP